VRSAEAKAFQMQERLSEAEAAMQVPAREREFFNDCPIRSAGLGTLKSTTTYCAVHPPELEGLVTCCLSIALSRVLALALSRSSPSLTLHLPRGHAGDVHPPEPSVGTRRVAPSPLSLEFLLPIHTLGLHI
jgi:hypothetical protein